MARNRTCAKCFANVGPWPAWVAGKPYCHGDCQTWAEEKAERRNAINAANLARYKEEQK
jgi:hypothetical protein